MKGRQTLRAEAEARLARDHPGTASAPASSDVLHEFQVHQIELEMQNEELRRTLESLEEAHERYVSLYEFAPIGYVTVNGDGTISEVNLAGEPLFGVDRALLRGNKFAAYVDPEDGERWHCTFTKALNAKERQAAALKLRRPDGTNCFTWIEMVPVEAGPDSKVRVALADITEYHRMEEDLRATHAQRFVTARLASIETLVAGVAHEINHPLAANLADHGMAVATIRKVRDHLRGSEPLDRKTEGDDLDAAIEELNEARQASRRIERIVRDLRAFGKSHAPKEAVRLIDIIDHAMCWVPATVRSTATVRVENGGAPDVLACSGQLVQVVVNLLTNAARAARPGRPVLIVARIGPGSPGMARLEIIDNGEGIAPQILPRVFDPFFTTGEVGQGMGLGLSTCHAIVTSHAGMLTVTSDVGRGSTFRVELPAAPAT
jgi:PAS domain S-box-containing protein